MKDLMCVEKQWDWNEIELNEFEFCQVHLNRKYSILLIGTYRRKVYQNETTIIRLTFK